MKGLKTCILHSNIPEIVQRLDHMLTLDEDGETPGILVLLGLPRTGKKRVLNYWIAREHLPSEQRPTIERPLIADITVWRTERPSFSDRTYVTPMTCVVFSELAYRLGSISTQFQPTYAKHWCREPRSVYTDRQFLSLFAFVRTEFHRLGIRTIVIRNAQWIDACTLEMPMRLREERRNSLSFVLGAQMQEKGDVDEPLADEFVRVPHAAEVCGRIELQRLHETEYVHHVVPALLFDELNVLCGEGLDDPNMLDRIPHALWERTKHDWKHIDDVAKEIRQQARQTRDGKLVLSRAVLEDILKFSLDTIPLEASEDPFMGEDLPW